MTAPQRGSATSWGLGVRLKHGRELLLPAQLFTSEGGRLGSESPRLPVAVPRPVQLCLEQG